MIRLAINGYGRIGRQVLRALYEENHPHDLKIVAINSLSGGQVDAHLTQYDTTHGRFNQNVYFNEKDQILTVGNDEIKMYSERNPELLPWKELGIDIVLECTGAFTSKARASSHLRAGAKKVLISAPGNSDVDATIVYGINHHILTRDMLVVSNASCTTNCLAPLAQTLHLGVGINKGLMTTIHAYTNDQVLTDSPHQDLRRARSATMNMIPTKTGAAQAVGLVLPELSGRLDGFAVRVPTSNVSLVDLSFEASKSTTVQEVNALVHEASEHRLKGILAYNSLPLVSIDFNHHPAPSIFDATLTKVIEGTCVKVLAWYDNEWGFSNQMLKTAYAMAHAES
jgi:glyceraldehyde 3-phosphate dehydrogenase